MLEAAVAPFIPQTPQDETHLRTEAAVDAASVPKVYRVAQQYLIAALLLTRP